MAGPLTVRYATGADLRAMAAMFAARHRADRARTPYLDPQLEDPAAALGLVAPLLDSGRAQVAIAESDGQPAGFLLGEEMLFAPTEMASQFVPPHSISMPIEGHGVAAGHDPVTVYRALYGFLARDWIARGFFIHRCAIAAGDAAMQEAWVSLGFGRYLTAATRPTTPVTRPAATGLDIERASPEDIEVVAALIESLNLWHWEPPISWPMVRTAEPAAHAFTLQQLRSGDQPYFVGYQEGRPAGMQTFLRPGFTPPIVDRAHDVYLFEGVVSDDARGGGIGTALLRHSMAWARGAGFETCTLHFAAPNPSGGPFWLGHGFIPVEHTMERRIDERVAWAR